MLNWFRRQRAAPAPGLSHEDLEILATRLPAFPHLGVERAARLSALAARFLRSKAITPVHGLELDHGQRVLLAGLACLPLMEFGVQGLHGWSEVVVYPGAFRVHRRHHDEDTGVVAEWEDDLAGESWEQGPLILSWDDILADLAEPGAGYHLVAHEMAHKLDALDGVLDGTPPLPPEWQQQWARDFQQAYEAFCVAVDAGTDTDMDDYAAEAPEEFFAVASEYHFSAPDRLAAAWPAVADHLRRFYGPPPVPSA